MNTRNKMKGYVDGADIMLGFVLVLCVIAVVGLLIAVAVEASKPLKYGVVAQDSIECLPAVEAVEATDTTEAVAEQGPYTCTITATMDDQFMRDLYLSGAYLQTLEYGQHHVGDPYPEHPEEEVESVSVEGEANGASLSITITTDGSEPEE